MTLVRTTIKPDVYCCTNCGMYTQYVFYDVVGWLCEECLRNMEADKWLESVTNVETK